MNNLFLKYEQEGLSLTDKIQLMEQDLLSAGFYVVNMKESDKYKNYAYLRADSRYAVVIMEHKFLLIKFFCVLNKQHYEKLKHFNFCVNIPNGTISDDIQDTSKCRVLLFKSAIGESNFPVYEKVVDKGELPEIDHQFHSHGINVEEYLRPCAHKQNMANTENSKSDDPEFCYKSEENFKYTWYAFIYWKVLRLISKKEAYLYNFEYNVNRKK